MSVAEHQESSEGCPGDKIDILREIEFVLRSNSFTSEEALINEILAAKTILLFGAGRVGFAMASFAKRLRHLSFDAHWLNDVTVPSTGAGDLLLLGSGSGETKTVLAPAKAAQVHHLKIAVITQTLESSLAKMSDTCLQLEIPKSRDSGAPFQSIQPLTSLFEQSLSVYLDALVLRLMRATGSSSEQMALRHNVVE